VHRDEGGRADEQCSYQQAYLLIPQVTGALTCLHHYVITETSPATLFKNLQMPIPLILNNHP
jgi:hypothetical protein